MDKQGIKKLINWLENATDAEIREQQQFVQSKRNLVSTREGLSDLKLALRLIDEEVLARLEISRSG